ncbi:MAG: stage V sporulation protein S [Chloroflexi bacterium]|nr:stage V sporulation protein S [Chloroflexota bacterium]
MAALIRVSTASPTRAVAGAIAGMMREHGTAEVQAIGAGALNQAIKALTLARTFLEAEEREIMMTPSFIDVEVDGTLKTAIRLKVFWMPLQQFPPNGAAAPVYNRTG